MSILLVDDDSGIRKVLELRLHSEGFRIISTPNARTAYEILGMATDSRIASEIDLILMDILMPDIRGIDACREIKSRPALKDIPIILMTASTDDCHLEEAFNAGAMDFISKPFQRVELLVRIRSALRLKSEIDRRKRREEELIVATRESQEANLKLQRLAAVDGLTEIFNRRYFDHALQREFQRCLRNQSPIAVIMIDIDGFKQFNDFFGHVRGDQCLKRISSELKKLCKRSHDFIARYGGEELVVVLPETAEEGAEKMAETLRARVESLAIDHPKAPVGNCVTISLGVACLVPQPKIAPEELVRRADRALYQSKSAGRNRVMMDREE